MKRPALYILLVAWAVCCAVPAPAQAPAPVEATPKPAAAPAARPSAEPIVNFSFDQVDVSTFVKLVGEITGRKFVVGDGVTGKITVVSPMVPRKEVYPLFVSILESVGCSVVQDGELCRIIALPKRDTLAAPVVGSEEPTPAEGVVTKVIRLQNVSAAELRKVLESKVGGGKAGAVGAIEETNHLIITDTAEMIRRIEKIIAEIDKPGLSRTTEVVPLEFAGAEDVASQLNQAMTETDGKLPLGTEATGNRQVDDLRARLPSVAGMKSARRNLVVVASPHSNSLILVGTPSQIGELKKLVKQMDVDSPAGRGRLNAVFLKYISAADAAKSISALLAKSDSKTLSGPQKSKISIEASVENNALLVDASPGDFDIVKKLIAQLDQSPEQVHINVTIWEVSSSDGLNVGFQFAGLPTPTAVGDTVVQGALKLSDQGTSLLDALQGGIFPKGISVGVSHGAYLDSSGNVVADHPALVNIDALRRNGKFKVLSNTSLEAQNNKEAMVRIVNEIPVLKSTIEGGSGSSRDVIQNIDRMDVGIKLKLTPHLVPGGEVQMVLAPSIEAVVDSGPEGAFSPTIAKREVQTTVSVADGRTIVIAGLTREDKTKVVERVPILGSIPLLGALFRHTTEKMEKTDLLILVTPRVVTDQAAAEALRKDWEQKTGLSTHEQSK